MIRAYAECYLPGAKACLASALQYSVNDCGIEADRFAQAFVSSGLASRFGEGDPGLVAGVSGIELARLVLRDAGVLTGFPAPHYAQARTPEHWAGFVLARYQWEQAASFAAIFSVTPLSEIVGMYALFHEMSEARFAEELNRRRAEQPQAETRLAQIRRARGFSQPELSRATGVGLRSIKAYEQRENDINKAQAIALMRLSHVLGCRIEDLLEPPVPPKGASL